jgi:predicted Zn finger-like uncharacterized protein
MALATKCPHCGTTFRVASDQLKLRGGIVRCGACKEIFDGNAGLTDLESAAQAGADEEKEVYVLDLGHTFDPVGILPKTEDETEDETAQAHADGQSHAGQEADAEPEAHGNPDTDVEREPDIEHESDVEGEPDVEREPDIEHETGVENEPLVEREPEVEHEDDGAEREDDVERETGAEPETILESAMHAEPVAHAGEEPKPIFAMGSALLEEPEPIEPTRPTAERVEPTLGLPVDEELVAAPPPDMYDEPLDAQAEAVIHAAQSAPLLMRESADMSFSAAPSYDKPPRSKPGGRRSKLTPTRITPPKLRVPEIDEPEFVKRGRQREQTGKRRTVLMAAGSTVLIVALAAQGVAIFRNELAARFPAAKPALAAACPVLGCRVELPAQIENLGVETGELQALGASTYVLTTLLHNQASLVQAWPHIELTLLDSNDKPVLRRVFKPSEYLPQGTVAAGGIAARGEQPVKLSFQLDQLKPNGYRIAVFYP